MNRHIKYFGFIQGREDGKLQFSNFHIEGDGPVEHPNVIILRLVIERLQKELADELAASQSGDEGSK